MRKKNKESEKKQWERQIHYKNIWKPTPIPFGAQYPEIKRKPEDQPLKTS